MQMNADLNEEKGGHSSDESTGLFIDLSFTFFVEGRSNDGIENNCFPRSAPEMFRITDFSVTTLLSSFSSSFATANPAPLALLPAPNAEL